jgi:hypothetical protein
VATARVNPKLAPADSLKREIQAGISRRAQTIVERIRAARGG